MKRFNAEFNCIENANTENEKIKTTRIEINTLIELLNNKEYRCFENNLKKHNSIDDFVKYNNNLQEFFYSQFDKCNNMFEINNDCYSSSEMEYMLITRVK